MTKELGFLDEVAAFLDLDSLPSVVTPRTPTGNGSSSESVESENSKSSSSENEMAFKPMKQQNIRERPGDNRRKRYRDRVKNERKELKQLERHLTGQIHNLLSSREGRMTSARTDVQLSKTFWRDLAGRQNQLRLHSEAEQMRLVAFVQSQAAYIDHISSVVRVQPQNYTNATDFVESSVQPLDNLKWLRLKSSSASMYEIYTKELNENYARIDKVFEECGMDSMSIGSVNSRHQLNSNRSIEYIQHVSKQLRPFSFENMYKKLCKISKMLHRDIDRDVYEDNNTLALKFRLKHTLATGSTVSILSHKLSRQFHDNDRVVFMWKSFWEGEGVLSGMDADGTAWVSIRPYSDGSTSGTLMEVCARQVPAPLLTMNPNASAVKDFKEMMGRAFKEDERETFTTLRS